MKTTDMKKMTDLTNRINKTIKEMNSQNSRMNYLCGFVYSDYDALEAKRDNLLDNGIRINDLPEWDDTNAWIKWEEENTNAEAIKMAHDYAYASARFKDLKYDIEALNKGIKALKAVYKKTLEELNNIVD